MYCTIQCAKSATCFAFYTESSVCHESASNIMVPASNNSQNVIDAWLSSGEKFLAFFACIVMVLNSLLEKHIADVILTCDMPPGYTLASSNTRKAYKMIGSFSYSDAQTACKADKSWLAMPKSSDDLADINQLCNKALINLKPLILNMSFFV